MNPKWMPGVAALMGLALAGPTAASAAVDPYNTARSRLDDIIAALGYTPPAPDENGRPDRRAVLDRLAAKEISVEEAMKLLRG